MEERWANTARPTDPPGSTMVFAKRDDIVSSPGALRERRN
jgi:hypothetical protein